MSGFFNVDNTFFSIMGKIWDMICLSVIWAVLCLYCFFIVALLPESFVTDWTFILFIMIQGITIGPATTALYYSVVKVIRKERGYLIRSFFQSFQLNFKVGAIVSELFIVAAYIIFIDFQYAASLLESGSKMANVFYVGSLSVSIILITILVFIFPVLSRFTLTVIPLFKTTFLIAMKHIVTTIGLIIILVAFVILIFLFPIAILLVPSLCILLMSFLIERVFKKYMPPAEDPEETRKDEWYLS